MSYITFVNGKSIEVHDDIDEVCENPLKGGTSMLMTNNEIQNLTEDSIVFVYGGKYYFTRCKTVKGNDGYVWLQNDSITDHTEWICPDGMNVTKFLDDYIIDTVIGDSPSTYKSEIINNILHPQPNKVLTVKDIDKMIDEKNRQNPGQNQKNKNTKPVDKFTKPKNNQKNNQKNGKHKKIKNRFGGDR